MIRRPQHPASSLPRVVRALGHARALGLLMLLTAVAVMHAVVFACAHPAGSDHHTGDHTFAAAIERHAPTPAIVDRSAGSAHLATGDGSALRGNGADDHSTDDHQAGGIAHGLHACVFILAALGLSLGLAIVARVGGHSSGARPRPRLGPRGGARPPPWTVLSLSELSILRI